MYAARFAKVGFVLMMTSLFGLLSGMSEVFTAYGATTIPIFANLTFVGVLIGLVTIWMNVKAPSTRTEKQSKAS